MTDPAHSLEGAAALRALHRRHNQETAGGWDEAREHREIVMDMVVRAAHGRREASLCVLGAGNCNDLDLRTLGQVFGRVHLVDIDDEAVRAGLARQAHRGQAGTLANIVTQAPVDLTGAMELLAGWSHRTPSVRQIAELPDRALAVADSLPGRFDVVVSSSLLSQMMWTSTAALGQGHQALHAISNALGLGHLRAVSALLNDGGTAVLINEAADSDLFPVEPLFDPEDPSAVLVRAEAAGLCFAGTAPSLVRQILTEDMTLAARLLPPTLLGPWLWKAHAGRTALMYAAVATARACA